jgi:RNA-binding protein
MSDTETPAGTSPAVAAQSAAERRELRARAHALDPVVMVGESGATDPVVAETDRALTAHGLIKVRIFGDDRAAREAVAAVLVERLGCVLVQAIGKLVVLWRPRATDTEPRRAPIRRAAGTVPKKLAAQGKTVAPRRRVRIPMTRDEVVTSKAPPRRRAGPGMRTARGALDPTAAPYGSAPAPAPARPKTPRTRTSKASADEARSGSAAARGSKAPARGARTAGARGADAADAPARPRSPARGGPGRKPAAARGTAQADRGNDSPRRGTGTAARGASGTSAPSRSGAPPRSKAEGAPARGPTPARSSARGASASRGGKTGTRNATAARAAAPSPARPPAGSARRTGVAVTGSGRPAPRTRAVRRGR